MTTSPPNPVPSQPTASPPAAAGPTRTLESHELLRGQARVLIRHHGELYRLQMTRQGKLILTK